VNFKAVPIKWDDVVASGYIVWISNSKNAIRNQEEGLNQKNFQEILQ
jgi:hypothetical protein